MVRQAWLALCLMVGVGNARAGYLGLFSRSGAARPSSSRAPGELGRAASFVFPLYFLCISCFSSFFRSAGARPLKKDPPLSISQKITPAPFFITGPPDNVASRGLMQKKFLGWTRRGLYTMPEKSKFDIAEAPSLTKPHPFAAPSWKNALARKKYRAIL